MTLQSRLFKHARQKFRLLWKTAAAVIRYGISCLLPYNATEVCALSGYGPSQSTCGCVRYL